MWLFWLIAAGIFFIGEILTVGFLIFWLGIGALIALVVSIFTSNIFIQTAAFVFSSITLILCTKSFADKFTKKDSVPTNVYTLNGKTATVIEEINVEDGKGQIKVGGEVWSATCESNLVIPKDSKVRIVKIQGVKAFVEPIKVPSTQN